MAASWGVAVAALIAGVAIATLALVAPAEAAKWRKVTSEAQPSTTSEVGLERTADGVLHVLWPRDSGATEQVMHSAIAANGRSISGPHQVATTSNSVNNSVDLVASSGGGLRAFFAGIFPSQPYTNVMATATAGPSGTSWSAPAAASKTGSGSHPVYIASGIGAAVTPANVPISAWGDSSPSGGGFHVSVSPATADVGFSSCACERDPNVAVDGLSGVYAVAWNYLAPGSAPDSVQVVVPAVSPVQSAPRSAARWLQQRVGLTGRIGAGGIYAAYGSGSNMFNARPALWRLGDANAKVLRTPRDAEHTTIAPAPGGRLWIAWEGKDRGRRIFATRTNPAATRFGAIVATKPPRGADSIHGLKVEGSRGFLDVVALAKRGSDDIAHWTARLRPGLTVKAKPAGVKAGGKVTFTVSDAGTPVANAKVRLKLGKKKPSKQTNGQGKTKIKVPSSTGPGRYSASATKVGYAPGKRKVRVK